MRAHVVTRHSHRPPIAPVNPMRRNAPDLELAVWSAAPVLLTGPLETTEALAYWIHSSSGWRHGPFLRIDCRSADMGLEKRMLDAVCPGVSEAVDIPIVQLAQPGTVLLREVGSLSSEAQNRLAERLIETYRRKRGHSRRVIASTSESLLPRVEEGTFDDRLFYRLNVIHVVTGSAN